MQEKFDFAPIALVIDPEGNKIGQMSIGAAKQKAKEYGLDLIEVAKQDNMSVCKIMDIGKWQYEQKKKHKKHKVSSQKEIKFRMRIDPHDQQIKINHIREFLEKDHDVKIIVEMKGREKKFPLAAKEKISEILSSVSDYKSEPVRGGESSVSVIIHSSKVEHVQQKRSESYQQCRQDRLQEDAVADGRREDRSTSIPSH